jgi:hypothetical protein
MDNRNTKAHGLSLISKFVSWFSGKPKQSITPKSDPELIAGLPEGLRVVETEKLTHFSVRYGQSPVADRSQTVKNPSTATRSSTPPASPYRKRYGSSISIEMEAKSVSSTPSSPCALASATADTMAPILEKTTTSASKSPHIEAPVNDATYDQQFEIAVYEHMTCYRRSIGPKAALAFAQQHGIGIPESELPKSKADAAVDRVETRNVRFF